MWEEVVPSDSWDWNVGPRTLRDVPECHNEEKGALFHLETACMGALLLLSFYFIYYLILPNVS